MLRKIGLKADLSIQLVVIIALSLVVFLILVGVFYGRINVFGKSQTCAGQGGTCGAACGENAIKIMAQGCPDPKDTKSSSGPCCLPKKEIGFG